MPKPGGGLSSRPLNAILLAVVVIVLVLTQRARFNNSSPAPTPALTPAPTSPPKLAPTPTPEITPTTSPRVVGSPPPPALRIAAWNIEWLGKPDDRSGLARDLAQSPADLADYIKASGASIIALQEIVTQERGDPIRSRELEAALSLLQPDPSLRWQYVLFPGRADGDQLTGLLWNPAVVTALNHSGNEWDQTRDRPWALPIPRSRSDQGSALWNRPPHAMKFSAGQGKTDIVVIALHMKADYNGDFAPHRAQESLALIRALPEVRSRFKDNDIILIGDTNCSQGPEPATQHLEAAGFADLNASGTQTHWQGGAMDRAFVPRDQPEFKRRSFEVLSDSYLKQRALTPRDFKRRFSDHYMILTTIEVAPDDD